jgi:hypothetical protein
VRHRSPRLGSARSGIAWWCVGAALMLGTDALDELLSRDERPLPLDLATASLWLVSIAVLLATTLGASPSARLRGDEAAWLRFRPALPLIAGTAAAVLAGILWVRELDAGAVRTVDDALARAEALQLIQPGHEDRLRTPRPTSSVPEPLARSTSPSSARSSRCCWSRSESRPGSSAISSARRRRARPPSPRSSSCAWAKLSLCRPFPSRTRTTAATCCMDGTNTWLSSRRSKRAPWRWRRSYGRFFANLPEDRGGRLRDDAADYSAGHGAEPDSLPYLSQTRPAGGGLLWSAIPRPCPTEDPSGHTGEPLGQAAFRILSSGLPLTQKARRRAPHRSLNLTTCRVQGTPTRSRRGSHGPVGPPRVRRRAELAPAA